MKRLIIVLVALAVLQLAAAENATNTTYNQTGHDAYNHTGDVAYPGRNFTYNGTNFTGANLTANGSGAWLPNINLPNLSWPNLTGGNLTNMTKTGVEPVDQLTNFLVTASPFLLLLLGVGILLLAGFARLIGIILIALALIRIIWVMMGW